VPTDFRDGKTFPRRGRDEAGGALWLLRVFDKARAAANHTIFDYIYPCPMDQGVFARWGITSDQFDDAIAKHQSDADIVGWLQSHVSPEKIRAGNEWLLSERQENLDRQDREEGVTTSTR
jgi:Domain of unknown function (DUF5069)